MFDLNHATAVRAGAIPRVGLPIRILLALRGAPDPETAFNAVGIVRRLVGRHGDERANKVLLPFVWAKSASDEQLRAFIDAPWLVPLSTWVPDEDFSRTGSGRTIDQLRVADFPGAGALAGPTAGYPTYDIIHFAGRLHQENGHVMLALDAAASVKLAAGALRDALIAAACRLLILQVPEDDRDRAAQLAQWVCDSGGPSVLCVAVSSRPLAETYFANLYVGLLHNEPLSQIAATPEPRVEVVLYLAQGGEQEWRLDSLLDEVKQRLESARELDLPALESKFADAERYGHRAQTRDAREMMDEASATFDNSDGKSRTRDKLDRIIFDRESNGVVPLTEAMDATAQLESYDALFRKLEGELAALPAGAPRVLNANFASPRSGGLITPKQSLQPGSDYDLLVDIGPRWDQAQSIVSGHAAFPADALPPDENGHKIKVVFASDAFEPRMATAWLWLPSKTGRSQPILYGVKQQKGGPVALRLRTPALDRSALPRMLHGRLCLYFENNLLQSAIVRTTLAQGEEPANLPNEVKVDFVLTGGFRNIERLGTRDLAPVSDDAAGKGEPVALNLTLNDDGGGTHRIIVPGVQDSIAFNYNPVAADQILSEARTALLAFFYKRRESGEFVLDSEGKGVSGIEADNGKTFDGFLWDLYNLARQGGELFGQLFRNVIPKNNRTAAQLIDDLRAAITTCSVIQIARTGSADYVFPWGLVYDYELTGLTKNDYRFCPVVKEWQPNGRRNATTIGASCPHGDHRNHRNLICPYGFWGLRHRIEQPPSQPPPSPNGVAPREPERSIKVGRTLVLQAALTGDVKLDQRRIADHVQHLAGIGKITFTPPAAQDWNAVTALLKSPQALYFLCHGEFDKDRGKPYLGIGLRDDQPQHRIYPNDLDQILMHAISKDDWSSTGPLIFINGCHTTDLSPLQLWNFVSSFTGAGAGAVIGTEISVRLPVATEAAEMLFKSLANGDAVSDAVRSMRWALANRGNLLGLAYTPYGFADLKVAYGT